jgi:HlyD family secretion protein
MTVSQPPIDPSKPLAPPANASPHAVPKPRPARRRSILLILGALVVFGVAGGVIWKLRAPPAAQLATQAILRGTLTQTATATGTVNPQDTISVGSQVSGTISELLVDYNSRVHKGEILARIDPSTFAAQLEQARAALAQAVAQGDTAQQTALAAHSGVSVAQADAASASAQSAAAAENLGVARAATQSADAAVRKSSSAATLAATTLQRDRTLLASGYIAQSQFDIDASALVAAQTALDSARVSARQTVLAAAASLSQARAGEALRAAAQRQVAQMQSQAAGADAGTLAARAGARAAQSLVQQAQVNLNRAVIVSPVDGTVIARNVSVGQTIAASFAAPTLFTIAKDLTKMEVDIAVGEPDIGSVTTGAPVAFTVLAYPTDIFRGIVSQVRENPTTVSNVVTYTVVMLVANTDGRLRPGMTATAAIRVAQVENAFVVPLAALQWQPPASTSGTASSATPAPVATSAWGQTDLGASGIAVAGRTGAVYVERGGTPQRVAVKIDLLSGAQAAVTPIGATFSAGDLVVVGTGGGTKTAAAKAVANPLTGGSSSGGGATRGITH